jgi:hypothetical protein
MNKYMKREYGEWLFSKNFNSKIGLGIKNKQLRNAKQHCSPANYPPKNIKLPANLATNQ